MSISCSVKSLDFGEVLVNAANPVIRKFSLTNNTESSISFNISIESLFIDKLVVPLAIMVDEDDISEELVYSITDLNKRGFLKPFATQTYAIRVANVAFSGEIDASDWTVIRKVNSVMSVVMEETEASKIPLIFSLCLSLLSTDEDRIDLDNCTLGNTYVRDLQVWNRSECALLYTFRFLTVEAGEKYPVTLLDFDLNSSISFNQHLLIPAFGSKRIRFAFKAKVNQCYCVSMISSDKYL